MILAIIQARMGSTRLPKKVLAEIQGVPMIGRIHDRLTHCKKVDKIVIATSTKEIDNQIVEYADANRILVYAGSENDIVDRMYQTALKFKATAILRITGDCPLVDPKIVDRIATIYKKNNGLDYIANIHPPTYPDGLDVELISSAALKRLWDATRGDPFNSEWFYNYITENPDKFNILNIKNVADLSRLRWTVDFQKDLDMVRKIFSKFKDRKIFYMDEILKLMEQEPDLSGAKFNRDQAYKDALVKRQK